MNRLLIIVAAVSLLSKIAIGQETLAQEVYSRTMSVLRATGEDPQQFYGGVLGGGFMQDGMSDQFVSFCSFVSNRCEEIVADWLVYETNDMVRFTVQSAIGFCGFQCQTNLVGKILSLYEENTNSVSYSSIEMASFPYGIPLDAENYLALHYDTPGVSNIIAKISAAAAAVSDTNTVNACARCLSGERKRCYVEMKSYGAL